MKQADTVIGPSSLTDLRTARPGAYRNGRHRREKPVWDSLQKPSPTSPTTNPFMSSAGGTGGLKGTQKRLNANIASRRAGFTRLREDTPYNPNSGKCFSLTAEKQAFTMGNGRPAPIILPEGRLDIGIGFARVSFPGSPNRFVPAPAWVGILETARNAYSSAVKSSPPGYAGESSWNCLDSRRLNGSRSRKNGGQGRRSGRRWAAGKGSSTILAGTAFPNFDSLDFEYTTTNQSRPATRVSQTNASGVSGPGHLRGGKGEKKRTSGGRLRFRSRLRIGLPEHGDPVGAARARPAALGARRVLWDASLSPCQ